MQPAHCYAFQNRQLDTTDPVACNVPEYIQQAQLMKLVDRTGTAYPAATPHTIASGATSNTAVTQ